MPPQSLELKIQSAMSSLTEALKFLEIGAIKNVKVELEKALLKVSDISPCDFDCHVASREIFDKPQLVGHELTTGCLRGTILQDYDLIDSYNKFMNTLGKLAFVVLDLQTALEVFKRLYVHQRDLTPSGNNKRNVAVSSNNLGCVYLAMGRQKDALRHFLESVELSDDFEQEEATQMDSLGSRNNLGRFFYEQGDYPKALETFQDISKALEAFEESRLSQPIVLTVLYNKLAINLKLLNYTKAEGNLLQIKSVCETLKHSKIEIMKQLVSVQLYKVCCLQGNTEKANTFVNVDFLSLEFQSKLMNAIVDPIFIETIKESVDILVERGELATAKSLLGSLTKKCKGVASQDHPWVGLLLHRYGYVLILKQESELAAATLREALDVYAKFASETHPHVISCRMLLGGLEVRKGNLDEALTCFTRGLEAVNHSLEEPVDLHFFTEVLNAKPSDPVTLTVDKLKSFCFLAKFGDAVLKLVSLKDLELPSIPAVPSPPESVLCFKDRVTKEAWWLSLPVLCRDFLISGLSCLKQGIIQESSFFLRQSVLVCASYHSTCDHPEVTLTRALLGHALLYLKEQNLLNVGELVEENLDRLEAFGEPTDDEREAILLDRRSAAMATVGVVLQSSSVAENPEQMFRASTLLSKYTVDQDKKDEVHNELYFPLGEAAFYFSTHRIHMHGEIITLHICLMSSLGPQEEGQEPQPGESIFKTLVHKASTSGYQFTIIGTSQDLQDIGVLRSLDKTILRSVEDVCALLDSKRQSQHQPQHYLVELKSPVSESNVSLVKKEIELLPLCLAIETKGIFSEIAHPGYLHSICSRQTCESTMGFEFADNHTSKLIFGKVIANSLRESQKLGEIADLSFGNNAVVMTVLTPLNARIALCMKENVLKVTTSIVSTEPMPCPWDDCAKQRSRCSCSSVKQFFLHVIDICVRSRKASYDVKCHTDTVWCSASADETVMVEPLDGKTPRTSSQSDIEAIIVSNKKQGSLLL